jgi:hypothetical protein
MYFVQVFSNQSQFFVIFNSFDFHTANHFRRCHSKQIHSFEDHSELKCVESHAFADIRFAQLKVRTKLHSLAKEHCRQIGTSFVRVSRALVIWTRSLSLSFDSPFRFARYGREFAAIKLEPKTKRPTAPVSRHENQTVLCAPVMPS